LILGRRNGAGSNTSNGSSQFIHLNDNMAIPNSTQQMRRTGNGTATSRRRIRQAEKDGWMWIVALIVLAGVVTTIINRALPLRARLRRHREQGGVAGPVSVAVSAA